MNQDDIQRPSHDAIHAALLRIANGEAFLSVVHPGETDHDLQQIDTVSGWRFAIAWCDGRLRHLHQAISPSAERWDYGCARWPDWLAGDDAVVLDPISHLLSADERQRLEGVLRDPVCWPAPVWPERIAPSLAEIWTEEDLLVMGGA